MDITDTKMFDGYVARIGWINDNSGHYRDEDWTWYAGSIADLILLRQAPNQVALVRYAGLTANEIFLGEVATSEQFDQLMKTYIDIGESVSPCPPITSE